MKTYEALLYQLHIHICRALFQYKDRLSRYGKFHYQDKTIVKPSYLYNGDSRTGKMGPRVAYNFNFQNKCLFNPPNATKIYFAAYVSFLRDFSSPIYILKASYHNFWKTNSHYRCLNIEYNTAFTRRPSKWQDRKKSKYKYRTTLTNDFSLLVQAAGCITPLNHFQNFCLVFHATVGIVDPKYEIYNHSIGRHTYR